MSSHRYPFGSAIPSRNYNSSDYRYGFNGKENDKETGEGSQDFGAREYDNRLGRWWSIDAHKAAYTSQSPYSGFYNNPNIFIDGDGRDNIIYIVNFSLGKPGLDIISAAGQLQLAVDAIMGTDKVKVVILTPEQFDKSKLDANGTDVVIAYGNVNVIDPWVDSQYPKNGLNKPTPLNPENSDPNYNVSKIADNYVAELTNQLSYYADDATEQRPGNSAQDALVFILLHSVGHMVAEEGGHSEDGSGVRKEGHVFDMHNQNLEIHKKNFMNKADITLSNISKESSSRNGLDYSLKSFGDYTFAKWNRAVFNSFFTRSFKAKSPVKRMGAGKGNTTYFRGNSTKVVSPRFK